LRKEKEREFYMQHMDTFKAIGLADPFFTIKTAFYKKGKFGRQCQFFEWELKKGDDIYIEFYENVYDSNGKNTNVVPMLEERQLFKLKFALIIRELELYSTHLVSICGNFYRNLNRVRCNYSVC